MTSAPTLDRIYTAMKRVANARFLLGDPTSHVGDLGEVEGIAHELAHQLEAGRNFEQRLDKKTIGDSAANEHEASTLRIEVAALRALGIKVSLRRLWRDAAWRGETPALTQRPLTPREKKCVVAFMRIVETAVQAEATDAKSRSSAQLCEPPRVTPVLYERYIQLSNSGPQR